MPWSIWELRWQLEIQKSGPGVAISKKHDSEIINSTTAVWLVKELLVVDGRGVDLTVGRRQRKKAMSWETFG